MASRARIVSPLVLVVFLIFFQGFMVAPLLPRLAIALDTDLAHVGALIPAYMLPYGCVCLVIGAVANRFGSATVLRYLLIGAATLPALSTTAKSVDSLLALRALTGIGLGGIAPLVLAVISELYPYEERGRPMGWVFGAIAGGMAAGATVGPWLEPSIGWRGLFLLVSLASLVAVIPSFPALGTIARRPQGAPENGLATLRNYVSLVSTRRGATVYAYVFLNGVFHSGVFSWLGVYFTTRFGLTPREMGFAFLGYGIPGFLFGPIIGRAADRFGRRGLIRLGLALASACALALSAPLPVLAATVAITLLSLGFDLTHPLFAGIVSTLDSKRASQAMALNTFAIFVGLGVGSAVFGALYFAIGMSSSLIVFSAMQLALVLASFRLHHDWK